LGSCNLEVGSFGCLVVYLEREEPIDFEGKSSSLQDFKLYFLGLSYSWTQVLYGGSKMSLLFFVDRNMHESLRA